MWAASFEGVSGFQTHTMTNLLAGDQSTPKANRGASEIARGTFGNNNGGFVATVEPWHGNQIVAYPKGNDDRQPVRRVLDVRLLWGHAIRTADLDGDRSDEIIAGIRDDLSKNLGERRGVRIYKCTDGKGEKWERQIVDDGGIACEDLTVCDLDGDGRPDIIASGRQTGNVRIYWNKGKK